MNATLTKVDDLLMAPYNTSYKCSLPTEVEFVSTAKDPTWLNINVDQLQVFTNNKDFLNGKVVLTILRIAV